jgi:hypothetical protein
MSRLARFAGWVAVVAATVLVAGCSSTRGGRPVDAPVWTPGISPTSVDSSQPPERFTSDDVIRVGEARVLLSAIDVTCAAETRCVHYEIWAPKACYTVNTTVRWSNDRGETRVRTGTSQVPGTAFDREPAHEHSGDIVSPALFAVDSVELVGVRCDLTAY